MNLPPDVALRIASWRETRHFVALGNLGEHVALLLLEQLGYQVLGTQEDYLGMVPHVLGEGTTAHPEDFIAVDPEGRLLTINSKATASPDTCRLLRDGRLAKPRIARLQRTTDYSTQRAILVSPLEGDSYAQVVKIDLINLKAQVFDIDVEGGLTRVGPAHNITGLVKAVLAEHPDSMPPPTTMD